MYLLKIGKKYDSNVSGAISGTNEWVDVSYRIVEDSIYQGLSETEKKYYAHYKRGSNRIENVVITAGITLEDDNWPWDKAKDNNTAFTTSFVIQPLLMIFCIVGPTPNAYFFSIPIFAISIFMLIASLMKSSFSTSISFAQL